MITPSRPSVNSVLSGKSVLLTGSTGFIAKFFLEKLIRTVPDIGHIYLLIRAQDGVHSRTRAEHDIFSSSIFNFLKDSSADRFRRFVEERVTFVIGDTSLPRLGLSGHDFLRLNHDVDLVINAAASTDFMNRLDHAVSTNSLSARSLAEFTAASRKARLIHLSTCYVNEAMNEHYRERLYPQAPGAKVLLPIDGHGMLDLELILAQMQSLSNRVLNSTQDSVALNHRMIRTAWKFATARGWNNIYTFTKWLGENFLARAADKIHCTIVRPSIVESALNSPHAGWIEGWKVGDPLLYAVLKDMIRVFPAREDTVLDLIPVDLVCNAIFAVIPELMGRLDPGLEIFHICNGEANNRLHTRDVVDEVRRAFHLEGNSRRPILVKRSSWALIDGLLAAAEAICKALPGLGKRAHAVSRLRSLTTIYSPYTYLACTYDFSRMLQEHDQLTPEDRQAYPVTYQGVRAIDYLMKIHIPGIFKHILKVPHPFPPIEHDAPTPLRKVP